MSRLPLDAIMEILSRLPIKSLLLFRCLSKSFHSLIDSPDFIKLHLNRSMENNSNLSLILVGITPNQFFSASLDSNMDNKAIKAIKLHRPFDHFVIFGSCNGLLALQDCNRGIALWNPSTKKHKILPKFWNDFRYYDCVADGFGYDTASDDYKLVRIIQFGKNRVDCTEVTVYSLKTDSWRQIKELPFPFFFPPRTGALAAGALHWLAFETTNPAEGYGLILAFDLKTEEFFRLPLPDIKDRRCFDLQVLGGSLSLTCIIYNQQQPCSVWVMKEYGVVESWTKLFSCSVERLSRPLAYSKNGDKILVHKSRESLYWYHAKKMEVRLVHIHRAPHFFRSIVICVDSLVLPHA